MSIPWIRFPRARAAAIVAALLILPACASTGPDGAAGAEQAAVVSDAAPAPAAVAAVPSMAEVRRLMASQRYAEVLPGLQAITQREPQNAEAWFDLAFCLHASGRLEEAVVAHARAAQFESVRPIALYNLGCAHALLGDADAAFEALGRAVDAGFEQTEVLLQDAELRSLHGDARWDALVARLRGQDGPA